MTPAVVVQPRVVSPPYRKPLDSSTGEFLRKRGCQAVRFRRQRTGTGGRSRKDNWRTTGRTGDTKPHFVAAGAGET